MNPDVQHPTSPFTANSNVPNEWPNNSQCTLRKAGSALVYSDGNPDTVTAVFRLEFRPHVRGRFGVKSWATWCPSGVCRKFIGEWSAEFLLSGGGAQSPIVQPVGFQAHGGPVKVGSERGEREVFFLRFEEPHGVQQIQSLGLNVTANPAAPSAGDDGSSGCKVTVNVASGMISLAGSTTPGYLEESLPVGVTIENARCRIHPLTSRLQALSPTEAVVRLDVEFKSAWTGTRYLHRQISTQNGSTGWLNPDGASFLVDMPLTSAPVGGMMVSSWDKLKTCVENTTNSPCVMAAGSYVVDKKIWISRSNVTIRGASKYATTLVRKRTDNQPDAMFAFQEAFFAVQFTSPSFVVGPFQNIRLSNFTIGGNRTLQETQQPDMSAMEIAILNVKAPDGSYGFVVEDNRFVNSPYGAISSWAPLHLPEAYKADQLTRKILIRRNDFVRSSRAPIVTGIGLAITAAQCDMPGTEEIERGSLPKGTPEGLVVERNFFEQNDTGAFGINEGYKFMIRENAMMDNYNNGRDCGGGMIAAQHCLKELAVNTNFLWNRNVVVNPGFCSRHSNTRVDDQFAYASGLEFWGTGLKVEGNSIHYFPDKGVFLAAVQNVQIKGNSIRNTSRGFQSISSTILEEDDPPAIQLANCFAATSPPSMSDTAAYAIYLKESAAQRPVSSVEVSNNTIGNVFPSYLCSIGSTVGCLQSIYQPFAFRIRRAICTNESPGPMGAVTFSQDASIPSNRNRLGSSCAATDVQGWTKNCPSNANAQRGSCGAGGCQ